MSAPTSGPRPTTGAGLVHDALLALGVDVVFGIASIHNLPIVDAIRAGGVIQWVTTRHEQAAVHAADAYARVSGRLGVVVASTGPGTANTVAGLYEAMFSSSPVLLITGQVKSAHYGLGRAHVHEAEAQVPMLQTVARRVETVRRTADIEDVIIRTATDILTGRPRPGAVEIPIDLQYAPVLSAPVSFSLPAPDEPPPEMLDRAAEVLAGAEHVVILAGAGVHRSGAHEALASLAAEQHIPVLTTRPGRGAIPDAHPAAIGALANTAAVKDLLADADVLLAVGTSFDGRETLEHTLRLPSRIVHIDVDPAIIGRCYPAEVALVSDARLALEALATRLGSGGNPKYLARFRQAGGEARADLLDAAGADYATVVAQIAGILPPDATLVFDACVPAFSWGMQLLPVQTARRVVYSSAAAIGPGLPFAIGAARATGRPTLAIHGDGGLMVHIGELATAAENELPIIVCVFNDRGYGSLRALQGARSFPPFGVDLLTPDFAAVARAMGAEAESVEEPEEFGAALARAVDARWPYLLDINMATFKPMRWP